MTDTDDTFDRNAFHELCEAAIENRADAGQLERLEKLVLEQPEARRYYVESVYQHLDLMGRTSCDMPETLPAMKSRFWQNRLPLQLLGAAAVLSVLAAAWLVFSLSSPSPSVQNELTAKKESPPLEIEQTIPEEPEHVGPFARVREIIKSCQWENDFPNGKRIGKEELHLTRGIAQLCFDNGVVVTMEAPVRLSVLSPDRCFLHSGKVVARVSPEGTGFVIDTPKAMVEDLGTEFGVQVQEGREAEVRVFSGRVDVHREENRVIPLLSGRRLRFSSHEDAPFNPNVDVVRRSPKLSEKEIVCTTSKEAIVLSGGDYKKLGSLVSGESDVFLLVKNSGGPNNPWNRKAYFSIDLSAVPSRLLENAQLELAFGPAGVGFESRSADVAKFSVYGITDQEKDDWDPESVTWDNAPANMPGGNNIDLTQVILIGHFEIEREEQTGVRILSGMALKQFLEADTNDLATFVLVCDTQEPFPIGMGYAYGFANRNHPELPPPTLRLVLAEQE